MNSTFLPPAMGKKKDRLSSLVLEWRPVEKENFKFKPVKLLIKTDIMSNSDRVAKLGKFIVTLIRDRSSC